jgi:hypothetical protein
MKMNAQILALLACAACGIQQAFAQIPSPVSWWKGESNVVDSVGTNNGSVYVPPAVGYVPGYSGQAFSFGGGIINIADAADLKPASVTVQLWVKAGSSPGAYRYLLSKSSPGGASYAIYTGGDGGVHFYAYLGAGGYAVSAGPVAAAIWDDNWHQLTGTWDGSTARLYMDGAEVGTGSAGTGTIAYTDGLPLLFGDYQAAGGLPYGGAMDEVKVFNRALTAEDAAITFTNLSSATGTNGLIGWWKGEGNANDSWGTHNGTAPPPRAFSYTAGRSGTAFFPQGGVARVPDSVTLQPANVTLSAWVKSVGPGLYQYLVSKSRTGGGVSYAFYTGDSAGVRFLVYGPGGTFVVSPQVYPEQVWDGTWHLVTGSYDGATSRVYLDGIESGTGTPGAGAIEYTNATYLVFGAYSTSGDNGFTGELDDVKVYDHVLTAGEVMAAFKEGRLLSWWPADQNANDPAGGNNGTLAGGATYSFGRTTGGSFNTKGGSVQVPDAASLHVTNFTLQAMVSSTLPGTNKYIISKSNTATDASYALFTGPSGGLAFYITTAGGRVVSPAADASIWDGFFHVVDGTYDGQKVRLYVDGKEVGTGTAATGSVVYGAGQSSGKLLFGDFADSVSSANFVGRVDEVKLYGTPLTAAESAAAGIQPVLIVKQPAGRTFSAGNDVTLSVTAQGVPPLTYQWQRYGTNLPGSTGSALTLSNAQPAQAGPYSVLVSGGTLLYTNSNFGQAFRHGAGGIVRVPNAPIFETNNFTIQCWARCIGPGTYRHIIAKARDVSYYSGSYGFYTGGDGGAWFYVVLTGGSLGFVYAKAAPTNVWDGAWHQLTGTWDGEFVNLYLDGILVQGVDSFGGTIDFQNYYLNGDFLIGDVWSGQTPGPWHFPGDVDEVKYFDHALSDTDVLASYNNLNSPAGTNGLVSWWKADGNTLDFKGNHDGFPVPPPGSVLSDIATLSVPVVSPTLTQVGIAGGNFRATVSGTAGQAYVVLRSPDLKTWGPLVTNTGSFTFTDPVVAGTAARFYRAQAQ